jgi:hypothetical protein
MGRRKMLINRREIIKCGLGLGAMGLIGASLLLKDRTELDADYQKDIDRDLENRIKELNREMEYPQTYTPVSKLEDLDLMRKNPHGCFEMMNDIDLKGIPFESIGTYENPGSLIFNGNNFSFINLHQRNSPPGIGGLFGYLDESSIVFNLSFRDFYIHKFFSVGTFVACNKGALVNCHALNGKLRGDLDVGGIVGRNNYCAKGLKSYSGIIKDCSVKDVSITTYQRGGGIIGNNDNGALISVSFSGDLDCSQKGGLLIGSNVGGYVINPNCQGEINGKPSRKKVGGYLKIF